MGIALFCFPQAGRAHHQLAVHHALQADQMVGEVAELRRRAPKGHDLEAEPLVEVDVHRGQDSRRVPVSGADEAVGQLPLGVVVDEGQAPDGLSPAARLLLFDETTADEVADGLGPVA